MRRDFVVTVSDLWSTRPGISFCLRGRLVLPERNTAWAPLVAVLLIALVLGWAALVASMSPGGADAVAAPVVFTLVTLLALGAAVFRDSGALPIHISTLVVPDCEPREHARSEPAPLALSADGVEVKFCLTCRVWRLPGARHCSVCGHCVAGYDHHCDAIARCVGEGNLQAFTLLVVSSTVAAIAFTVQGASALLVGTTGCAVPTVSYMAANGPLSQRITAILGLTLCSIGGTIFTATCLFFWRSRLGRLGNTLLITGFALLLISLIIAVPRCSVLIPAFLSLVIGVLAAANFFGIAAGHAMSLATRAHVEARTANASLLNSATAPAEASATTAHWQATVYRCLIAIGHALITSPPPSRVDFSADASSIKNAIESARKSLYRAADSGESLTSGNVSWRGGPCVQAAMEASLVQSSRLADVEAYAKAAALCHVKGVLAGDETWPDGLCPAAYQDEKP
jgi:hypothetical protein